MTDQLQWTQDPPEAGRLHLFLVPTGELVQPLEPETTATPMRFVGKWEDAAALGVHRSAHSEPDPGRLPEFRTFRWPFVVSEADHRPGRVAFYQVAQPHLEELRRARAGSAEAWWRQFLHLTAQAARRLAQCETAQEAYFNLPRPPFDTETVIGGVVYGPDPNNRTAAG